MDDAINSIPPDAWPLIDLMFNITCVVTALWLAWTVFIWWRRSASNLTSVPAASPNSKATPDFLSIDKEARKDAIKRGESFDKELKRRDREALERLKHGEKSKLGMVGRIGRIVSLLMALFSIATMISGTMFQVSILGTYWERYSASERLMAVIESHPIGVAITVFVILYNLVSFVISRKREGI